MSQQGLTKFDPASRHIAIVGISTLLLGIVAALIIPGVGSASSLTVWTALAIFVGAMVGALVTAHEKISNWLIAGVVTAGVTTIITSLLYSAFQQSYTAVVGVVLAGSFLATIVSKWYASRHHRS